MDYLNLSYILSYKKLVEEDDTKNGVRSMLVFGFSQ